MDVQIYTTPTCGYCLNAKNWFNEHGIEYTEHTLVTDEEKLEFYQRVNNVEEKLNNTKQISPRNTASANMGHVSLGP